MWWRGGHKNISCTSWHTVIRFSHVDTHMYTAEKYIIVNEKIGSYLHIIYVCMPDITFS